MLDLSGTIINAMSRIYPVKIEFTGEFDALLCLNADFPDKAFFGNFPGKPIIAADGAAYRLRDAGVGPDYIVGDMDSFTGDENPEYFAKTKVIKDPDQESNDFEKILRFAVSLGYKDLLIIGFHGGELEHTLNNWSVLKRFAKRLNLTVFDKGRYAMPLRVSFEAPARVGEMISLIPQSFAVLTTKNLKWPLNGESLRLGNREGARNVATAENVEIKIEQGEILYFCEARLPFAPAVS
ncbi:MAG: thiamine diphosphokinase [Chloroflexota bacterium]